MKEVPVSIAKIVGGGICVSTDDGNKVHEAIYNQIKDGNRVRLSFSGVTRMTTAFLNAAIGQLYGEFSETDLRKHLAPPIDTEPWQLNRLKLVVDRAKEYFSNPNAVRAAFLSATGIEDEK
jgi:hypothetical protein